jgi:hypothetical protein
MHGLENRKDSQRPVQYMDWFDEYGERHRAPVMSWALETLATSDLAPLSTILAARLEIMQVFYGGPENLAKRLELDVATLRKFRYRNYFQLTGKIVTRIDSLWDRTYRILRYGQKA